MTINQTRLITSAETHSSLREVCGHAGIKPHTDLHFQQAFKQGTMKGKTHLIKSKGKGAQSNYIFKALLQRWCSK